MKILFIIPSYKPAYLYGGTTVVVSRLAETLVKIGHEVTVYTTTANGKTELPVDTEKMQWIDGVQVHYFKRITGDHTHLSPALFKFLNQTVKNFNTVHIHSWWSLLTIGAALICKLKGIKPFISPHGMLSSYTFSSHNRGPKKIIHSLLGKHLLKNSYLHACTGMEWQECLEVIPSWKGFTAYNLIDLPKFDLQRQKNQSFTIVFLSRIDRKKGLELLFEALSKSSFTYLLKIGGSGEQGYLKELKALAGHLKIMDKIEWLGWRSKEEKFKLLHHADLFVLTSYSENFAIVVIEALSVATPVLVTKEVGISDYIKKHNFGWITTLNADEIAEQLNNAYGDVEKRKKISDLAPGQIEADFNEIKLANQYAEAYLSISLNQPLSSNINFNGRL